ncbi:MFS transporter [Nocardia sp. NPDC020380]|uniref:MFS transporter n=1 Tax=Nocardia sp. NPDC020380 TaxID=3364309 RepID=UPI0037BA359A
MSTADAGSATVRGSWWGLAAIFIAVFMQMIDATIVTIALPDITRDIGASFSEQSLVLTIYTLALACSLLPASRLGGRYGRGGFFTAALAVFIAASVLCGIAGTPTVLILARAIQGAAAGAMSAQSIAIISTRFEGNHRTVAFSIYGAVAGVAAMLGPLLGGLLLGADPMNLSWRSIFLVNLFPGAIALVISVSKLRGAVARKALPLDLIGTLLSAAALFALVYSLSFGREKNWSTGILALLAAAVVLFALFVIHERRYQQLGREPLVDITLFGSPRFVLWILTCLVMYGVFAAYFFVMSLSVQVGLGRSPLQTGLLTLPFSVGAVAGALWISRAPRLTGSAAIGLGSLLFGVSLAGWLVAVQPDARALTVPVLVLPLIAGGFGAGMAGAKLQSVVVAAVPARLMDSATGLIPTAQQVGNSFGVALIGVLFFHQVAAVGPSIVADEQPGIQAELATVAAPFSAPIADRFARCATMQFTSPTPERTPPGCARDAAANDSAQPLRARVEPIIKRAATTVIGRVFLTSYRTTLWVLLALTTTVGVAVLGLPAVLERRRRRGATVVAERAVSR